MRPDVANDMLNTTLATLQSLIRCCIQLKQEDPEALKLSDEIARRVAKDLRLYGGNATSFSPQLLSCAAVNSVVDDDPCIKSHPHFHKMLNYCPLTAVGTLPVLEDQATGSLSIIKPLTVPVAIHKKVGSQQKAAPSIPAVPSSSHVMEDIIVKHGDVEERPIHLTVAPAEATLPPPIAAPVMIDHLKDTHPMESTHPKDAHSTEASHPAEPELTAKDILQAIQDLGSKFDLLAMNDQVDALDAKVVLVEEVFGHQLATLEQRMNSSDAQWKAMTLSVGHLTNCLQDHKDDLEAHRLRMNTTAYAPPQHLTIQLPAWLHGASGVDDLGISTVCRQWTHAWDPSVTMGAHGCLGTSALAMRTGYPLDTPILHEASVESSRLSSMSSTMSDKWTVEST
ncbi:hypothetical protein BDR06DRAFT_1009451 [Suillus hirtellus]|nr:hypothetical protein BDR06DRAFT_1009451 [Suillus hirtellus]